MGILSGIGKIFKPAVDVTNWMDTKSIGEQTSHIADAGRFIFTSRESRTHESFSDAVQRLRLSQEHLNKVHSDLIRLSWIYGTISLIVMSYAAYLIYISAHIPAATTFIISLVTLSLCFKKSFWAFQIKQQKLGCSISEWFAFLRGKKS